MKLLWINYDGKYALYLVFKESSTTLHALKSNGITPAEVQNIRKNLPKLQQWSGDERYVWLKANAPSIRSNYRTLHVSKIRDTKHIPLKEL